MTRMDHPLDAEPIGLFERMCACWTAGDAHGYGACFTEDCDYVSYDGTHGEGVAVLHATGSVQMPWRASLPKRRLSRQTVVAVKTAGGWRVAALHIGRVPPVRIPAPDSFPAPASRALTRAAGVPHIGRAR